MCSAVVSINTEGFKTFALGKVHLLYYNAVMDPHLFFTLTDPKWSTIYTVLAFCFVIFTFVVVAVCWYKDDDYRGYK